MERLPKSQLFSRRTITQHRRQIRAYKCPGCSGEISNKRGFLFHLEINDGCAETTRSLLVNKLGIGLEELEEIYGGGQQTMSHTKTQRHKGKNED